MSEARNGEARDDAARAVDDDADAPSSDAAADGSAPANPESALPSRAPALDPDRLRADYARNIDNRLQAAMLGGLGAAAALYPVLLRTIADAVSIRVVATTLAVIAGAAAWRASHGAARGAQLGAAALALAAAATGSLAPLQLLAAAIYAALAWRFFASLGEERSAVERAAKAIQPAAPDFIAPYCRRVTAVWGAVFAINAVVLAVAAALASPPTWQRIAGPWTWGAMAVIAAAEFLVRKTYFRNYWYGGPFERVWSRLFPAEATPMGRRSAAHIRDVRRHLGLPE